MTDRDASDRPSQGRARRVWQLLVVCQIVVAGLIVLALLAIVAMGAVGDLYAPRPL